MLELMLCALPFLLIFAVGYLRDLRERQVDDVGNCDEKGQIFAYIVRKSEAEARPPLPLMSLNTASPPAAETPPMSWSFVSCRSCMRAL